MGNGARKVRLALLGCGSMMGSHAKRLRDNPDVEICGLCDVSLEVVGAFQEAHLSGVVPAPRHFTDPARMYETLGPDAVLICTPHTRHFRQGLQALAAGCHVFMEKPMVTALADAYALEREVRTSGKIFVIGYNTSCSPRFHYLRETIRSRSLGKLELVTGFLSQDWMRATAGSWRQEPGLSGGGQAYDSGAHLFNSLCWSVEKDVEEVFAFVDNHGTRVDINSACSIRFAGGVLANITVSGNSPGDGRFMAFLFDKGRIEIDGWSAAWINVWQGDQKISPAVTDEMGALSPDHNFIDVILGRAEPKTSVRNGVVQSQLMEAFYESQRTGMPARPRRASGRA
jgi:predicted dehydrogenase